jgi:hypothetical protein
MFISGAYAQTSLYGKAGIGKTKIKKFETSDLHMAMSFNPGLYSQYELGIIHDFPKGFSVKLGGGLSNYACVISSPKEVQQYLSDYSDTHVNFRYISVPVAIRYKPLLDLRVELGLINNFYNNFSQTGTSHIFKSIEKYNYFKKYTAFPYWGINYTFFDRVELGFTDHIYLSGFATYTDLYEQTNGIEPRVFFKYNVWNVYVSYKIRLSKRDE